MFKQFIITKIKNKTNYLPHFSEDKEYFQWLCQLVFQAYRNNGEPKQLKIKIKTLNHVIKTIYN